MMIVSGYAPAVGWITSYQWPSESPNRTFEEFVKMKGEQVPLARIGTAEEFADMTCFLASDAGSYILGVCIDIDGGRSPVACCRRAP